MRATPPPWCAAWLSPRGGWRRLPGVNSARHGRFSTNATPSWTPPKPMTWESASGCRAGWLREPVGHDGELPRCAAEPRAGDHDGGEEDDEGVLQPRAAGLVARETGHEISHLRPPYQA